MCDKNIKERTGELILSGQRLKLIEEGIIPEPVTKRQAIVGVVVLAVLTIVALVLGCRQAHAAELTASWYSVDSLHRDGQWKITKGTMANGRQFSDNNLTCASWDYPLGSTVKVTRSDTQASVVVLVTDRTARRFKGKRIDLSPRAFSQLAPLERGVIKGVVVEII